MACWWLVGNLSSIGLDFSGWWLRPKWWEKRLPPLPRRWDTLHRDCARRLAWRWAGRARTILLRRLVPRLHLYSSRRRWDARRCRSPPWRPPLPVLPVRNRRCLLLCLVTSFTMPCCQIASNRPRSGDQCKEGGWWIGHYFKKIAAHCKTLP